MAPELLVSKGPLQHTFTSDIFAWGLIVHYMLANGRHPSEGSDNDGRHSIVHWSAVEQSITKDAKTLSADLSDEAKGLLAQVLSKKKDDKPKASEAPRHPFFWSDAKKVRFLEAVANQSEIGTTGTPLPSPVEQAIENVLGPTFRSTFWDTLFPAVYNEMTGSRRGRAYVTTSGVHLVRFIRNSYAHVSDRTRPSGFQTALLIMRDYIFLKTLPNLVMVVYKAVKLGNWDTSRQEIASVMESD